MNILKIIMGSIFGFSALYIMWCLYGATRYMRTHPDEFNMSIPTRPEDKQPDGDVVEDPE